MTGLYNKFILPKITHKICGLSPTMKQRDKVVPGAYGRVLEVGSGTGLNFNFYNPDKVDLLFALEPSTEMNEIAKIQSHKAQFDINFIEGLSEQIPLNDNEVDSIVITYTMCTISDVKSSLEEMHRVLKYRGTLIFCEHGKAPDASVQKWQNIINPVWKKLGGGCNLNRNIPELIEDSPFSIEKIESMYIPGFKPASFNYWGIAKSN